MKTRAAQVNFSKGEIAPELYGRFDVDTWRAAVKKARNVIILKYGGLTKRPGMRFVGEVLDDSEEQRLIPFEFSLTQTYALEFGQGYASPLALGGRVLEEGLEISAITAAANAQVTIAYHAYEVGERIYISGITGTMGNLLNGRFWNVVSVVDADNFTIDADTTGLAFTSDDGSGTVRTGAPTPPPSITPPAPVTPPPDPVVGGGDDGRPNLDPDTEPF